MSYGDPVLFLSNVRCSTEGCTSMAYRVIQSGTDRSLSAHCHNHKKEPAENDRKMVTWSLGGSARYVQKVVFPDLDELRSDRRGIIAEFHTFRGVDAGLSLVHSLISLLGGSFHVDSPVSPGEKCDCWVREEILNNCTVVSIHHKYWGPDQIDCLKEMVKALARLHNWVIEGNGCGLLDSLAELAPEPKRRKRRSK